MLKDLHNRLRPMGFADLLDETIELYKRNFVLLVGIAAFLYVPYFMLQSLVQEPSLGGGRDPQLQDMVPYLVIIGLSGLFYLIASPIVTGALTFGISERYLERETSIKTCYARILKRSVFVPFLLANLLVLVAVVGAGAIPLAAIFGGVALTVVGSSGSSGVMVMGAVLIAVGVIFIGLPVYVMLRLTLVAPVFMIEMPGIGGSLRRSWELMRGHMLKVLGLLLIVAVAGAILQGVGAVPLGLSSVQNALSGSEPSKAIVVLTSLLQTILGTVLFPVSSIVIILFYYDMRIRKEGFDLELLASELDQKTRQFSAQDITILPQESLRDQPYAEQSTPAGEEPQ